jgi:hypothetical protein
MTVERAIVGFPSWRVDGALSGGAWETDYPLNNLFTDDIFAVARSDDATENSTQFDVTLTPSRRTRLMGFINHNATFNGRFRLTGWADDGKTIQLFQTTWALFWPEVYGVYDLPWEDAREWTGQYTDREITDTVWMRPVWLDAWYEIKVVTVEVSDVDNPAGYFQCGAFDIAEGHQFGINPSYGAGYGFRFRTNVVEAKGGGKSFELLPKPRLWEGEIQYAFRDEALVVFFEMLRQNDLVVPLIWFPEPGNPLHWLRNAFWGRQRDPGLFRRAVTDRDTVPLRLEEVL